FSSRRRHTRLQGDWSSDVCSSDLKTILGAFGDEMQMTPDRPQEILRAGEALRLLGGQHLEIDELVDAVDAINIFGDPEQRVEIEIGRASCRERGRISLVGES